MRVSSSPRTNALNWLTCLLIAGAASRLAAPAIAAQTKATKLTGLLHNEDCTDFFYNATIPAGKAGDVVDRYIDVIADAEVTVLFCNTNARRTNYRSDVWETFWDGYDPDGPDTQPFLTAIPQDRRAAYRKLIGNMLEVHRQGVDYPARVIQRCRHHGISPWISLRMNDVHENNNLAHPFHSELWRKEELFRKGHPGYYARALDYAHAEVRNHYRALIVETLDRYDIDGLELDFMREPYLFSVGEETAGGKLLTEWLREIRRLVDASAKRRQHPIRIGVRVPSLPQTALGLGLDAPTWTKEGLADLVVATPRWATMQFDIPLADWRELLSDHVTLAGGLEVLCRPYPGGPVRARNPRYAVAAAISVLSRGGDVVYLFNHFQNGSWPGLGYFPLMNAFSSLDKLQQLPRSHAVTYREVVVPGQSDRPSLPASGNQLSFDLPLGPRPPINWHVEVMIELPGKEQVNNAPVISVNGITGTFGRDRETSSGTRKLTYSIPLDALPGQDKDTISVKATGSKPITVLQVEVRIHPGS
jgi:hypothetical protein